MTSTIDQIDLHVRSYRSALKSTLEITVNSLTNSHLKMEPILHPLCNDPSAVDISALVYSLLRLPQEIDSTRLILIGQNPAVFQNAGFLEVESWPRVSSPARRRTSHFKREKQLLAVFAASISDIDDLANILIAYQYQWNHLHSLVNHFYPTYLLFKKALKSGDLIKTLRLSDSDFFSLKLALGSGWKLRLRRIYHHPQDLRLRLLAGSWIDYSKTTQRWWKNIAKTTSPAFHISRQSIYFVSSNNHSLLNLITGFPLHFQSRLLNSLHLNRPDLYQNWLDIESGNSKLHPNDFLYYTSKFFLNQRQYQSEFGKFLQRLGVLTIPSAHYLDINTQLIPVSSLVKSKFIDHRLRITRPKKITASDALIFNIDYPLGFAAYHILNEVMENVSAIRGVYVLGKSAVLNSEIGDIQIPRLVFDEHTQNSYIFKNCFNSFFPFVNQQGSILTNQKAVSVLGTFLENEALIQKYSENNLTIIEMESAPYLNAITEATYDQQTPHNTIVDLNSAPFDIGIINYTSDTPYSKAKNLGSARLDLQGVEPAYLGSLAILQRIINLEESR